MNASAFHCKLLRGTAEGDDWNNQKIYERTQALRSALALNLRHQHQPLILVAGDFEPMKLLYWLLGVVNSSCFGYISIMSGIFSLLYSAILNK